MDLIKVNEEFLIQINIARAQKVFGFAMSLNFPLDAIEIIQSNGVPDIIMGDFLGERAQVFPNLSINTTNNVGTLLIGYSQEGGAPEKSGDGHMLSIKAKALKEGEHSLVWSANSTVKDSNLQVQSCSFEDLVFRVDKNNPGVNVVTINIAKP
ncbi:MAG: hypothetical protein ACE5HS_09810 [bacterium]